MCQKHLCFTKKRQYTNPNSKIKTLPKKQRVIQGRVPRTCSTCGNRLVYPVSTIPVIALFFVGQIPKEEDVKPIEGTSVTLPEDSF